MNDSVETYTEPLVSVILPTNRSVPHVFEAIDSVVRQTYNHWELILVDDGAPDPEGLEAASAVDPRIRVVHQSPSGLSVARNVGMATAAGEMLAFIDDDDVWSPDKLKLQVGALAREPAALGCYCGGWFMDGAGERFGAGWPAEPATREAQLRGLAPLFRTVPSLIRREAIERYGGFNPLLPTAEDTEFALRMLQHGEVVAVNMELYGIRRHDQNKTLQEGSLGWRTTIDIFRVNALTARRRGDVAVAGWLDEHLRKLSIEASTQRRREAVESFRRGRIGKGIGALAEASKLGVSARSLSNLQRIVQRLRVQHL
jgi:glycosyltransferase involved in cell wall biosynthesis